MFRFLKILLTLYNCKPLVTLCVSWLTLWLWLWLRAASSSVLLLQLPRCVWSRFLQAGWPSWWPSNNGWTLRTLTALCVLHISMWLLSVAVNYTAGGWWAYLQVCADEVWVFRTFTVNFSAFDLFRLQTVLALLYYYILYYIILLYSVVFSVRWEIEIIWTDKHCTCRSVCWFSSDFDVHLYLCNAAFSYLDFATFARLTRRLVFPIYAVSHCGLLMLLTARTFQSWRHQ